MSRFTLGPSLEVTEADVAVTVAAPIDADLTIVRTLPGGRVRLQIKPHDQSVNHPINVYCSHVSPPSKVPPTEQRTPEWFFQEGKVGSTSTVHITTEEFEVVVPGIVPGVYFCQTILEFAQ